jgi:hypothetical protein
MVLQQADLIVTGWRVVPRFRGKAIDIRGYKANYTVRCVTVGIIKTVRRILLAR